MSATNHRTMMTDSRGWNVTEIIDLPYGENILRLRRDGTARMVMADGSERISPALRGRVDLALLSDEDRATYDAWCADQDRFARI